MCTDAAARLLANGRSPCWRPPTVRPYAEGGRHELANGILLRSDLHTLFDRGYVTVTPDYRLEVSRRIRDEFENGRDYYALHGRAVRVPAGPDERPAPILLDWHNTHKFKR
jgi:putative restriction endonuclease